VTTAVEPVIPKQWIYLSSDHLDHLSLTGQLLNSECSSNRRTAQINTNRLETATEY
jgi:hypothetical protein